MRALVAILAVLLLLPAAALAQAPPAVKSDNVQWLGQLPEPGVISARFHGNTMFVSGEPGVSSYDVSNPEKPVKLDTLPLPHFENEDVDLNGDIMLVSNDPNEGKGILYVISIRDPRNLQLLSTLDTGVIDLVLPLPGVNYGTGHTASCIQNCEWAWLAGTRLGIDVVDLRDPRNPKLAGNFKPEITGFTTHDVQVDSDGLAWIAGFDGTAAYDPSNPLQPQLVHTTDESAHSRYDDEPANDGSTLNDFIHHNSLRMDNGSLAQPPPDAAPDSESNVVLITEEDYTRPGCEGAGSFQSWEIGGDGVLRNLDSWEVELDPSKTTLCSAHYFDERGGLVAQGWYEQGTRFLDVTDPRDIRQVGYWIPRKNVTWGALYVPTDPTGEIVYSLDNARGIDVLRIDREAPPSPGPPPRDEGAAGGAGGGAGGGAEPSVNVALGLDNRRRRVRRGRRVAYKVTISNESAGAPARNVKAAVQLPRTVRHLYGGKYNRRSRRADFFVRHLGAGRSKVFHLHVKIRRGRRIELTGSLTAGGDVDPRDNYAVDRDRVVSGRRRAGRSSAGEPSPLAAATRRMRTVTAPPVSTPAARPASAAFGSVCRLPRVAGPAPQRG